MLSLKLPMPSDASLLKVLAFEDSIDLIGMLSHQQARNEIAGKKAIILNPTIVQKSGTEVVTFAEGVLPVESWHH